MIIGSFPSDFILSILLQSYDIKIYAVVVAATSHGAENVYEVAWVLV